MTVAKSEILVRIKTIQADLNNLLDTVTDEQLTRPGVEGEWSVKDVVAHLLYWEQVVADELKLFASAKIPRVIPQAEIEALNDRNYQHHRNRPISEIKIDLALANQALFDSVNHLTEDILQSPCTWTDGSPIINNPVDEMGHWQTHLTRLHSWLENNSK